ncbi:PemB family protein [Sphingobium ummariense]|uniref:Uncharacterized protein n=1 Tax=Sphingobium ummariense RL-3 TaxID=1346791 RepID=T0K5T5_9SPHN|nr:hypothetical protein [Sphingobium ummariense]EQB32029.1 hypothetical protein M529_11835 [Sphingobium ummariense RL-3]
MTMFGGPTTDPALAERLAALEARIDQLTQAVDSNAQQAANAVDNVAGERAAGDEAAQQAVNQAVEGSVRRTDAVASQLGAEIVTRAVQVRNLNERVDGMIGDVDAIADDARLARDVALANDPIFETAELGRLATTPGTIFKALGPASQEATAYRNDGTTATPVFSFPSTKSVDDKTTSVSILSDTSPVVGQANGGATAITDPMGRIMGWSIPAGYNGLQSQTEPRWEVPPWARGREVIVRLLAVTTAGYGREITPNLRAVTETDATPDVETTVLSDVQSGTSRTIEMSGTVPSDALLFGARASSSGGGSAQATETFRIIAADVRLAASGARRAGERTSELAIFAGLTMAQTDRLIGPKWDDLVGTGIADNGASYIFDAGGRRMGVSIPANESGANSYGRWEWAVPKAIRGDLREQSLGIRFEVAASSNYGVGQRRLLPLVQAVNESGVSANLTTVLINAYTDANGRRQIEARVKLPAYDVRRLDVLLSHNDSESDTLNRSFELKRLEFRIVATAAMSPARYNDLIQAEYVRQAAVRDVATGQDLDYVYASSQGGDAIRRLDARGRQIGVTVPPGKSGATAFTQVQRSLDLDSQVNLVGKKIKAAGLIRTSPNFARTLTQVTQVLTTGGPRRPTDERVRTVRLGTDYRLCIFEWTHQAGDVRMQPYVQLSSSSNVSEEMWYEWIDTQFFIDDDDVTHAENLCWGFNHTRLKAAEKALQLFDPHYDYPFVVTVEKDGSGDFTTIEAAVESVKTLSPTDWLLVRIGAGVWDITPNYELPPYVVLYGKGRERTTLQLLQPDDADPSDIEANSVFQADRPVIFRSIKMQCRNARYVVHSDSGTAIRDSQQIFDDCLLEHLGNEGARAWQAAHGGDPGAIWKSTCAIGFGSSSGSRMDVTNSELIGFYAGFLYHTNGGHTKPVVVRLLNSTITARNDTADQGYAVIVEPYGAMLSCPLLIQGCTLNGDIRYLANKWFQNAPDQQLSGDAEIGIHGNSNTPAIFTVSDFGRALRFDSLSTAAGEGFTFSGAAADLLLGAVVHGRAAAGGAAAFAYGDQEVSGNATAGTGPANSSMGELLGDCSTDAKSLTVAVGAASATAVFSTDMTNVSNSTILATINAAIGSFATATLFAPGELYRPRMIDEEADLKNISAVVIRRGMVLAHDPDDRRVRAMTATDPATRYAGVAWEDIYPGEYGRVKTRGHLPVTDLLRSDSAPLAFADTFSIDPAKPGWIIKGGSQGLLKVIRGTLVTPDADYIEAVRVS